MMIPANIAHLMETDPAKILIMDTIPPFFTDSARAAAITAFVIFKPVSRDTVIIYLSYIDINAYTDTVRYSSASGQTATNDAQKRQKPPLIVVKSLLFIASRRITRDFRIEQRKHLAEYIMAELLPQSGPKRQKGLISSDFHATIS